MRENSGSALKKVGKRISHAKEISRSFSDIKYRGNQTAASRHPTAKEISRGLCRPEGEGRPCGSH